MKHQQKFKRVEASIKDIEVHPNLTLRDKKRLVKLIKSGYSVHVIDTYQEFQYAIDYDFILDSSWQIDVHSEPTNNPFAPPPVTEDMLDRYIDNLCNDDQKFRVVTFSQACHDGSFEIGNMRDYKKEEAAVDRAKERFYRKRKS